MALETKRLYLSWDGPSFAVFKKWGIAADVSYNTNEIDLLIAHSVPQGLCELIRALVPELRNTRAAVEKLPKTGDT